jgi:DNA-binding MarR family transcriptional regulator
VPVARPTNPLPGPGAPPPSDEVPERLRQVLTRLSRRLRQEAGEEISQSQVSALSTIAAAGPLTLGELAAREQVRPPSVTAMVQRLESEGLVIRRVDPTDRRVARVEITATGRRLLARMRARRSAYLARRFEALDPAARAVLAEAVPTLEQLL